MFTVHLIDLHIHIFETQMSLPGWSLQVAEKLVFAQAAQKGPAARRRHPSDGYRYPSAGWVQVRGVLRPYVAAPRERGGTHRRWVSADGPFSAACYTAAAMASPI